MNQNTVKPTQEERNAIIAEFMNLKGASKVGGYRYLCDDGYWRLPGGMKYQSSWDELMPVVAKLIDDYKKFKGDTDGLSDVYRGLMKIDIEHTYKYTVQAIGWLKLKQKGGEGDGNV